MKIQPIIETTGSITKVELLSTIEQNILPGTLVLTNTNPFPGFKDSKNRKSSISIYQSFYLILMYRYFPEKLERIAKALHDENIIECCSSFGEIIMQNKIYPCIRIKKLKAISLLSEIQDFYKKNDIKFLAYKKIYAEGKIKVFKHFKIIELAQGLYRDTYEGEKFYFNIPQQLNWKLFTHFTKRVKARIKNPNFDPALGIINRFTGPEDVIRIYDSNKYLERALEIKKYYLKELKKEKLLYANLTNKNPAAIY